MKSTVFIYVKEGSPTKVLDTENSIINDATLKEDGYKHICTLDAAIWIEDLCSLTKPSDVFAEVHELQTIHF